MLVFELDIYTELIADMTETPAELNEFNVSLTYNSDELLQNTMM